MKTVPSVGFHRMDKKSRADDVSSDSQPLFVCRPPGCWLKHRLLGQTTHPHPPVFNSLGLSYISGIWISNKFSSDAGLRTTFEPAQDAGCLPKLR